MTARDDHPVITSVIKPPTKLRPDFVREVGDALDEIDRLRAQVELAQADADRLAVYVKRHGEDFYVNRSELVATDRRQLLAAHDEAVAQR